MSADHDLDLLRGMLRIRRFEERCVELYSATRIRGFMHLAIGQEAVAVGLMAALGPDDAVVATYRDHGHALARGVPAAAVMAPTATASWPIARCMKPRIFAAL